MEHTSDRDEGLLDGLRRGDPEAQVALLKQYGEPLVRFLITVCRANRADAEDIAVETLYRAVEKIDSFRGDPRTGERSFRSWLFAIARNRWRDRLRASARFGCDDDELDWETISARPPALTDDEDSPRVLAVREALNALPDTQRQTLILHYGGTPLTVVAGILGAPPGTVRQWKRRGLAALETALRNHPALAGLAIAPLDLGEDTR